MHACHVQSALEMRDKTVGDVMTPLESVFMLEISGNINRKTLKEVSSGCNLKVALNPDLLCSLLVVATPGYPSTRAPGIISVGYC